MPNPDFGTKYKVQPKEETPFDARIHLRVHKKTKNELEEIANQEGSDCSATDIIRKAIYQFLEQRKQGMSV